MDAKKQLYKWTDKKKGASRIKLTITKVGRSLTERKLIKRRTVSKWISRWITRWVWNVYETKWGKSWVIK